MPAAPNAPARLIQSSVPSSPRPDYIPTLDGWRAVAIAAVMVSHSSSYFHALGVSDPRVLSVLAHGRLGVDLFFAISGYLICSRLLGEWSLTGSLSLTRFYYRRAFRILPLYLAYLLILWASAKFAGVPASMAELRGCLLFYRNYQSPEVGAYTNHFWSLSVEEHFYLIWPLLLLWLTPRRALIFTLVFALAVHVWRAVDFRAHYVETILPGAGQLWRTDTRLDSLLWGCFAALACFGRSWRCPAYLTGLVALTLVAALAFHFPSVALLTAILFPALIVSTIYCPTSAFSRWLEHPWLRAVGRLSYSLYVWQTIFLQTGREPDPAWLQALKRWPINLCLIVLLAITSHFFLEKPLIRLGRRLARRESLPPVPA